MSTVNHHYINRMDVHSYSIIDVKKEMMECINILLNMGFEVHIPVGVDFNSRLSKTLGRTIRKRDVYRIEVNPTFLKVASAQNVHNMIMHECIHCVEGCFNHGTPWKSVAAKVTSKYPQFTITRLCNDKEYGKIYESKEAYKYQICCADCGCKMTKQKRWSKTLESIFWKEKRFSCCKCHSTNLVIEYL